MGWQTIETAPKDGTFVLVFGQICGIRHAEDRAPSSIEVARYIQETRRGFEPISDTEAKISYSTHGWWTISGIDDPTHWMPLPEPPTPIENV